MEHCSHHLNNISARQTFLLQRIKKIIGVLLFSAQGFFPSLSSGISVYFVIVNAVACAFAATSTAFQALMGGSRGRNWTGSVLVVALDLTMVALLFSANGASAAVGLIALNGNPHTQWHKVCYCIQGGAALAMSMLGSFFFLCLVLLLTLNLHRSTLNY